MAKELESIDWIENQAEKNLEFHHGCLENLRKEAHVILSIVIVAIGSLFGYLLQVVDVTVGFANQRWLVLLPSFALLAYLVTTGNIVISKVLRIRDIEPPTNEPKNLLPHVKEYSCDQLRKFELDNLQGRIDRTRQRNDETAKSITLVRRFLCFAPVVFVAVFMVSSLLAVLCS